MVDTIRRMVKVERCDFDVDGDSLRNILGQVQRLITQYGDDATVELTGVPFSDGEYLRVFSREPETDEQMNTRIKNEQKFEDSKREHELREFERLKAKFGNS